MSSSQSPAVNQAMISAAATQTALQAAVARAEALGINITVAVYDSAVRLSGFLRMPGCLHVSADIARTKAKTVAGIGAPMAAIDDMLDQADPRIRRGVEMHPDFTPVHGGLPILHDGQLLGGVGVSGGSEDEDVQCAQAAIDAISNKYNK